MKQTKDNFSSLAQGYQKFRPNYPQALYDYLYSQCAAFDQALDCGSGNGQVALALSQQFTSVQATDISAAQLEAAHQAKNIQYSVQRAESTNFTDASFDLITVGQAYHWFDFEAFGKEAHRILKPQGIVAIWSYHLLRISPEIDALIDHFYNEVVGPYWDEERQWVDDRYRKVPFHFEDIENDFEFIINKTFSLAELEGYMNTWSAVKHYTNQTGRSPVPELIEKVSANWHQPTYEAHFPGFIRLGRKKQIL